MVSTTRFYCEFPPTFADQFLIQLHQTTLFESLLSHDDHKLKNITSESIEGNTEPSHRRFLIFNPLTKQLTNQLTNPLTNQTRQSVIQLNMNSPLPKRARNFQENIPPIQKESSIFIFNKPNFLV